MTTLSLLVAHYLQLIFLPAEQGALQHDLVGHGEVNTRGGHLDELSAVIGHAAAGTAEGKARANNDRKTDLLAGCHNLFQGVDNSRFRHLETDLAHGVAEFLPSLGLADDLDIGGQQFHPIFFQHAHLGDLDRGVEAGLAAQGGQQGVGPLALDHLGHTFGGDRLDIGPVGQAGIGHDGRRIGIDQHHLVAFFLEGLDRLRPGIVELAGLADDDRPGADDEYFMYVGAFWHVLALGGAISSPAPSVE